MSSNRVINYTSRTFNTILNDLNSLPEMGDKPDWIKKMVAGIGDTLFMNLNAQANNSYLRTAFTRRAVQDLLDLIDYKMSPQTQSSGKLTFYIKRDATLPLTFTKEELSAATPGSVSQSSYTYNARSGVTVSSFPSFNPTISNESLGILSTGQVAGTFVTGDLIRISSSGSLPSPLTINTDYYVITTDGSSIQLARSLANAVAGVYVGLTTMGSGTFTMTQYSFTIEAWNEIYISGYINIASCDGSDWQEFVLPDTNILPETLSVQIDGTPGYSPVDYWIEATATTKSFRIYYDQNNNATVAFGGGAYGIPPSGELSVYYARGGGALSNVSNLGKITNYLGGNPNITGVTNSSTFTGGSDAEAISHAINVAPTLLSAVNRFVTIEDGAALAESYTGVSLAAVIPNMYGPNSCQIPIVPSGGGAPSGSLLSGLSAYLKGKTTLDSINVICISPSYSPVNIVGTSNANPGYVWSTVLSYLQLALNLLFTERGQELVDLYSSSGIELLVLAINAQWGTSFTTSDYSVITTMIDSLTVTSFGTSPTLFSVYSYCGTVVPGMKYLVISSPSFPLSLSANGITTTGLISISQV